MQYRFFNKQKDYDTLCLWWDNWGLPRHPPEALSSNGIIVSKDGVDMCSGFLYSTDSYFSWIEFIMMNKQGMKKFPRTQRVECLEFLGDLLIKRAKQLGFKLVYAFGVDSQNNTQPVLTKWRNKNMCDKINHNMSQYYKIID